MIWDTLLDTDPIFAAWLKAQIGKAGVDCSALKAEHQKLEETVRGQAKRIAELEVEAGAKKRAKRA